MDYPTKWLVKVMLERQGKNWWRTSRWILQQTRILKGDLKLLGVAQTAADWRMVVLKTFVSLVVMTSKAPLASMTPNWNVWCLCGENWKSRKCP